MSRIGRALARATEQLDEPGREAALREGAHVAAESPIPARAAPTDSSASMASPISGRSDSAAALSTRAP